MALPKLLKDLLTLPTASFRESAIADYIQTFVEKLDHVTVKADRYGNLVAKYSNKPGKTKPIAFGAHMDHPAFVAVGMTKDGLLKAEFRGGVRPELFEGEKVRFWTGKKPIKGTIVSYKPPKPTKGKQAGKPKLPIAKIEVTKPVEPGTIGTWDLPDPDLKNDFVVAPGCDDIAGCAAMLELLKRLSRKQVEAEVYCLFTRAEEVGFIGAVGACKTKAIPKRVPIIAIETSSALPTAPIGNGPILRVGDRLTIYTPAFTDFCGRVAEDLAKKQKKFKFQRKLMDGGACEATGYIAYGYQATGICVALGNYHNMDVNRKKIGSEYISLADWQNMVDWFEAIVKDEKGYGHADDLIVNRLDERFGQMEQYL